MGLMMINAFVGATVRVMLARGFLVGAFVGCDGHGVMLRLPQGRCYVPWSAVLAVGELPDGAAPDDDGLRALWG